MARVALCACIGGLAFVVCAFGGFLPYFLLADAFLIITSLCNTSCQEKRGTLELKSILSFLKLNVSQLTACLFHMCTPLVRAA